MMDKAQTMEFLGTVRWRRNGRIIEVMHNGRWLELGRADKQGKHLEVIDVTTDPSYAASPLPWLLGQCKHGAHITETGFYVITKK